MKFGLTGTNVKFASTVQSKTIDPVWREIFLQPLPDIPGVPKLSVACFDHDMMGSQAMGTFELDLEDLRDHAVSKKWHSLEGGEGELELLVQWHHNPALVYDPFEPVAAALEDKTPNELCVAVAQGRNLAIKDKELLGSGGTSDPRAVLRVVGGSSVEKDPAYSHTTKSLKKTLNPRWREVYKCQLSAGAEGDAPPVLHCRVEDVDELTSADYMGSIAGINLNDLEPNVISRKWYDLAAADPLEPKKTSKNVHGDVELIVLYRYNPDLDWDPFDRDAPTSTDAPNELSAAARRILVAAATPRRSRERSTARSPQRPRRSLERSTSGSWRRRDAYSRLAATPRAVYSRVAAPWPRRLQPSRRAVAATRRPPQAHRGVSREAPCGQGQKSFLEGRLVGSAAEVHRFSRR